MGKFSEFQILDHRFQNASFLKFIRCNLWEKEMIGIIGIRRLRIVRIRRLRIVRMR